jgi:hypothetical protein
MRRDNIDLAVVGVAAVVCGALATVPWLRVPSGLLLVLVLPGYALAALTLPDGPTRTSPLLWRGIWTAGLSLAVAVFTGLLLNLTPVGLTRLTWTISLAAVTLAVTVAAALLPRPANHQRDPGRSLRPASGKGGRFPRSAPSRAALVYAAGAVAIAGAAIGLAMVSSGRQHTPGFAQLSLVPKEAAVGGQVTLGVRNRYQGSEAFALVLLRGAQPVGTWDFTLGAGQSWQRDVSAPAGQRLTARLTTGDQGSGTQSVAVTSS